MEYAVNVLSAYGALSTSTLCWHSAAKNYKGYTHSHTRILTHSLTHTFAHTLA